VARREAGAPERKDPTRLYSADSEDGEDIQAEVNSSFTPPQVRRVCVQARLVYEYLRLVNTENFSVVEGGADVESLAIKAVENSVFDEDFTSRTVLEWARDFARNDGYFTKDLRGSHERSSSILYIVHNEDLLQEVRTYLKQNISKVTVSMVQQYLVSSIIPKITPEEKKKYKVPDMVPSVSLVHMLMVHEKVGCKYGPDKKWHCCD